jgi:hypothetical protein
MDLRHFLATSLIYTLAVEFILFYKSKGIFILQAPFTQDPNHPSVFGTFTSSPASN